MDSPVQGSPKYREWLDRLPEFARRTQKGTVMCFKINVNRQGFGYFQHMTDGGRIDPNLYPFNNVEEAVQALRDAWGRAQEIANDPQAYRRHE